VDDHPIVRQGLVQLVNQQADLMVCCESEEPAKAFEAIATVRPDILVVDISLKSGSGLELIKNVKATYPHLPALVLSMHDELLYAGRSLRAGARGYISKNSSYEDVIRAMRSVLRGEIYLGADTALKVLNGVFAAQRLTSVEQLTDRELEIFRLIGCGAPTREIAEQLHLGRPTIETYRRRIKTKLRLQSGSKLSHEAFRWVHSEG